MERSRHPLRGHIRVVVATALVVLAVAVLSPRPALAIALKPVTVTITRVTQTGPHNGYDLANGTDSDFFARVFIDSTTADEGPRIDNNDDIFPNWTFSKTVPKQRGRIAIRIEIWDYNGNVWPSLIVDVDPTPCDPVFGCTTVTGGSYPTPHPPLDSRGLDLILDLNTGAVSSDASSSTTCVMGDDANLCFSISAGSDIFVPTTLTVTKTADTNDGVCNSDCSLREALNVATDDDTIIVPPGVYTLTFVKLPSEPGHLVVTQKGLKIIGPQTGGTAIIEQAPPSSARPNVRVFEVRNGAEVEFRNLTIRNGIADNNSVVLPGHIHGGGIHNHGKMRLINVTLTNNHAPIDDGGGIYTAGGSSSELLNVTIADNSALRNAGGIAGSGNSLKNTIVANNHLTTGADANCAGTTINNGNNLQFPGTTCGSITTADPRLKLANDGVYDLGLGSAAIDTGDNSACPSKDQRSTARPLDGNGDSIAVCDIGAIEDFLGVLRQPLDQATGTRPVTLNFDMIVTAGTSSLVISAKGIAPPTGFLRGSPASYYELKTTAEFSRMVQICIDYPASAFTSETALKLFRLDTAWANVTESLDTTNHTICGRDSKLGTFAIFQQNTPPGSVVISTPAGPTALKTAVSLGASFSDPDGALDSHIAIWDWGDGSTTLGGIHSTNTINGSHNYSAAGVYPIGLTVTDSGDAPAQAPRQYVAVYDPSAGFAAGGGWIESPAGAYLGDPSVAGRAHFGFVAPYRDETPPDDRAQLNFQIEGLEFQSTGFEWMEIAGPQAQYTGRGTINGEGDYGFLLTVIDGAAEGGKGGDRFHLKIWDLSRGATIYDNQIDGGDDPEAATRLGEGDIMIQQ